MPNQLDEFLGYEAPRWLDEPLHAYGVDRQTCPASRLKSVLRMVAWEQQHKLKRALFECAQVADSLGHKVLHEDLMQAAKDLIGNEPNIQHFCHHQLDPRIDL